MSSSNSDVVLTGWRGVFRAYRFNTLPLDAHLNALYKFTRRGLGFLWILNAERNRDGSLRDVYLYHLDPILELSLKEQDQGQTRKTLDQIKDRYAILKQLYPESSYSSAPPWFTRGW